MKKIKFIILFLVSAILIVLYPNIANAATVIEATETTTTSTGKVVKWKYTLDADDNIDELMCTNKGEVTGEVTIPSTIDGYTVVGLGKEGYSYSIKYEEGTFSGCAGLADIIIPNTVKIIGYHAFYGCTGLKSINIPDSVTKLGNSTFYGCTGLKTVTLSNNLIYIGGYSFYGCAGIKSITLPSSLIKIDGEAFKRCTGLTEIVIPDSVTTVGKNAFEKCTGLKNITLSKNMSKLDEGVFFECTGLTSVIIPENITTICGSKWYTGAFGKCKNLEKVLIPDNVATIEEETFFGCSKLTIYGNDDQESKRYAEENSINFKYISEWDDSEVGEDITPPTVSRIYVPSSSVSGCWDSNTRKYIVLEGRTIIINVEFSEPILATIAPTLTIKFGSGSNIVLKDGAIAGSTVAYKYTITKEDVGTMATVSLEGGDVKDLAENEATLSCPTLTVEYSSLYSDYIYANGTAIGNENNGNGSNGSENNNNGNNGNTQNGENNNGSTNNSGSDNEVINNNNGSNGTNNEPDTTITTTTKYPKAGLTTAVGAILLVIAIAVVVLTKYNKLRDI